MINKIITTEIEYRKEFSEHEDFGEFIRFWDDNITTMYSHNNIVIRENISDDKLCEIIENEIKHRKNGNKGFLQVYSETPVSDDVINRLSIKPDIEKYLYLGIETSKYEKRKAKENAKLLIANDNKTTEQGKAVDIVANYKHMTLWFAIDRINRKFEVYNDKTKRTNLYICYDGVEPVGNCELFMLSDIAKIEDFDIIVDHQRKGFGSFVLSTLINICKDKGIGYAYLVTDINDSAKEMYYKNGFEDVGYCTSMMFPLDK